MRHVALLLLVCLVGCAAAAEPSGAESTFEPPEPGPAEVIEGLNGQAFMGTLETQGFRCEEPQEFLTLQQWTCSADATDVAGIDYQVVILGQSPTSIHSIDASVDQQLAPRPDPDVSAGFLSFIAETAGFTGADTAAAKDWVAQNATTESIQLDLPGVTYNLRGPAELRALEIVATD